MCAGSLIWIPLQTQFVNPDNIEAAPEESCVLHSSDCDQYYTDPDMLERIPLMFLLLGAIYAVLGLLSVIMIREPRDSLSEEISEKEVTEGEEVSLAPGEVLRTKTFYQAGTPTLLDHPLDLY